MFRLKIPVAISNCVDDWIQYTATLTHAGGECEITAKPAQVRGETLLG